MRVRAIEDTYLGAGKGKGFIKAGTEFDYDGPPIAPLKPLDGMPEPEPEPPSPKRIDRRTKEWRQKQHAIMNPDD